MVSIRHRRKEEIDEEEECQEVATQPGDLRGCELIGWGGGSSTENKGLSASKTAAGSIFSQPLTCLEMVKGGKAAYGTHYRSLCVDLCEATDPPTVLTD
jgi:hypothetical protein